MSTARMTFPTIWDQHSTRPSNTPSFLSRIWTGVIQLAEAQSRRQAHRGFLPYI